MGHLRATCPKLSKPYPLNKIECVDKVSNCGSFDTSDYVCVDESHAGLVDSQPSICAEEESSELGLEFIRSWEFEQVGTQITDVQGHLLRNVIFWKQEL